MKLKEAQEKYNELSEQIVEKLRQKTSLSQKLINSKKLFLETGKPKYPPEQYKLMLSEKDLLVDEIKLLEEQRKLIMRQDGKK